MEKLSGSRGCFVCGDPVTENERSLGLDIFWDEERGETLITLDPDLTWCGYENTVHGGIIAAVCDDAMAWAVKQKQGNWSVTAKIDLTYRKPVTTGQKYFAKGSVLKTKGRKVSTCCRIEDSEGKLYAEAKALFILQPNIGGTD
jgi:uncharacterized protein (TIGR00369 family)